MLNLQRSAAYSGNTHMPPSRESDRTNLPSDDTLSQAYNSIAFLVFLVGGPRLGHFTLTLHSQ